MSNSFDPVGLNLAGNLATTRGTPVAISGAVTSVNSATGAITITGGSSIGVTTSGSTVTINNTGITAVASGTGISVATNGSTGVATVSNTGVTTITAGTGISVNTSSGAVTITNTAPSSLTQTTASAQSLTLVFVGGTVGSVTCSYSVTGIQKTLVVQDFTFTVTSNGTAVQFLGSLPSVLNSSTTSSSPAIGTYGAVTQWSGASSTTYASVNVVCRPSGTPATQLQITLPGVLNSGSYTLYGFTVSYI